MLSSLLEGNLAVLQGPIKLGHDVPWLPIRRAVHVERTLVAWQVVRLGGLWGRLNELLLLMAAI